MRIRMRNLKMKMNLIEHNDDGYHPHKHAVVNPRHNDTLSEKLFQLCVTFLTQRFEQGDGHQTPLMHFSSVTKPGAIWHWWGNGTSEIDSNYFSTTIQSKIPISSSLMLSNPSSESSVDSFFALDLPFHFPAPFCQAFLCLVTSSASQTPINSTTVIKCFPSITRLLPLMLFFLHCNTAF